MTSGQICKLWDKELCKGCVMYTGISGYWGPGYFPDCKRVSKKEIEDSVKEFYKNSSGCTASRANLIFPYCPACGKYHVVTTGGCPSTVHLNNVPIYSGDAFAPDTTTEQQLSRIINLLTEIEYLLRRK